MQDLPHKTRTLIQDPLRHARGGLVPRLGSIIWLRRVVQVCSCGGHDAAVDYVEREKLEYGCRYVIRIPLTGTIITVGSEATDLGQVS